MKNVINTGDGIAAPVVIDHMIDGEQHGGGDVQQGLKSKFKEATETGCGTHALSSASRSDVAVGKVKGPHTGGSLALSGHTSLPLQHDWNVVHSVDDLRQE